MCQHCAGVLVTGGLDSDGRVAYRSTDKSLPDVPVGLPEHDASLADTYNDSLLAAADALAVAKPSATNVIPIRLSCGLWPGKPPKSVRSALSPLHAILGGVA